jgi:NADPH-dependent 2,4-dienoyl-CoA reductase/sulfur reductase-like enzyme
MPERGDSYEVLIVGAGPAGIAAALAAAGKGARVGLVDEAAGPGGQIWRGGHALPRSARSWLRALQRSTVEVLCGWRIFDSPRPGEIRAQNDGESCTLSFRKLILANGARELFLPFPGWTLPGVMGAGALQALAKGGWPVRGQAIVVAGSGPLLLGVASQLRRRGGRIVAIAEQADPGALLRFGTGLLTQPRKLGQAVALRAALLGAPYLVGWWPKQATGDDELGEVLLTDGRREKSYDCDYLACGFGLVPNLELARMLGCAVRGTRVVVDERLQTSVRDVYAAGELTGVGGVDLALYEGAMAGAVAAAELTEMGSVLRRRSSVGRFAEQLGRAFALRPELRLLARPETIVCRCEDVSLAEIEPFDSWRAAKLHTRCGMGPCQGRVCGASLEWLRGWDRGAPRPPLSPVPVSSFVETGRSAGSSRKDGGR